MATSSRICRAILYADLTVMARDSICPSVRCVPGGGVGQTGNRQGQRQQAHELAHFLLLPVRGFGCGGHEKTSKTGFR